MLSKLNEEVELLERHITILKFVIENSPIGIIKLSELSGCPQHKVRYSLRILEEQDLIKPSLQGAVATRKAEKFIKAFPKKLRKLIDKLTKLGEHNTSSF